MMEKLDESYKLKVDLMRHELRVAEEQRELSLTNSKRRGKKVNTYKYNKLILLFIFISLFRFLWILMYVNIVQCVI